MGLELKGARETRQWLQRLRKDIPKAVEASVSGNSALSEMNAIAKRDVQTVVYAVYSPKVYQRTFELLNAVGAVRLEGSAPAAGIVIQLTDGVQAKGDEGVSYARFFLPEEAHRSFLNSPANRAAGVPVVRDFLSVWMATFSELVPLRMAAAIDQELARE